MGVGASLTSREGRRLETEFDNMVDDLVSHAYLDSLNSRHQGWWSFPVGEHNDLPAG